jgi:hypothetical protein
VSTVDYRHLLLGASPPRHDSVTRRTSIWVADVLGSSDPAVRKVCAAGRLDAEFVDGQWRITRASVEACEPRRSIW